MSKKNPHRDKRDADNIENSSFSQRWELLGEKRRIWRAKHKLILIRANPKIGPSAVNTGVIIRISLHPPNESSSALQS